MYDGTGRERTEKRRRETLMQSQAVLHERQIDDARQEHMTGFEPGEPERSYQNAPHEIMNLENAFGSIVLGVNRRQEYTFLVREKQRLNAPQLTRDQKIIDGDRKKVFSTCNGLFMTNSHDERQSAAAVRTRRGQPPDRLIQSVGRFAAKRDQQAVREALPFAVLPADREQERLLETKAGELRRERTRESMEAADRVQGRLEVLRSEMWKKERMRRQIERRLKAAMQNPSRWLDDLTQLRDFLAAAFGTKPRASGDGQKGGGADGEEDQDGTGPSGRKKKKSD
ncbi:MAG: hypothetical protein KH230_21155 [Enterocloster asparagiformis]|nr:hypothetical protein [Enterocloster asparagiformis]